MRDPQPAVVPTRSTQHICVTFVQCWTNVEDVGPTLYKCHTNVLCLLGSSEQLRLNTGVPGSYPAVAELILASVRT